METNIKARILAVGDELLNGEVVDTNSTMIARELVGLGIQMIGCEIAGDDRDLIAGALKRARHDADIILVTGGLGPTHDDLTSEAAAKTLKRRMCYYPEAFTQIRTRLERVGLEPARSDKKQAFLPEGATILENQKGTAPGFVLREEGVIFVLLPGVPQEAEYMLKKKVIPYLIETLDLTHLNDFRPVTLRLFGLPEARVSGILEGVGEKYPGVRMRFLPNFPEVWIRLDVRGLDSEGPGQVDTLKKEVLKRVGDHIFSMNDEGMEEVVGRLLRERGLTIAVAESCTGGLITKRLTDVPGSSKYLERGIVCYSNRSKVEQLGVDADHINEYGAVSEQVALKMAGGINETSGVDIGVSVTGIAGPTGGISKKPVGTVYIGLAYKDDVNAYHFTFSGSRRRIRTLTAETALDKVRRMLLKI